MYSLQYKDIEEGTGASPKKGECSFPLPHYDDVRVNTIIRLNMPSCVPYLLLDIPDLLLTLSQCAGDGVFVHYSGYLLESGNFNTYITLLQYSQYT